MKYVNRIWILSWSGIEMGLYSITLYYCFLQLETGVMILVKYIGYRKNKFH